jgi:hypothetical protein
MNDQDTTADLRAVDRAKRRRERAPAASVPRKRRAGNRTIRHFHEVTYCIEAEARWEPRT